MYLINNVRILSKSVDFIVNHVERKMYNVYCKNVYMPLLIYLAIVKIYVVT